MNEFSKSETFNRFGKNFQEKLCQLMLEDRPFFDQITEVLDIDFFEKKYTGTSRMIDETRLPSTSVLLKRLKAIIGTLYIAVQNPLNDSVSASSRNPRLWNSGSKR